MGSTTPPRPKSAAGSADAPKPAHQRRCPICTAPTEQAFRPFCSRRCADVDLSRWLRGAYAIPGRVETDEDGDETAAASGVIREGSRADAETDVEDDA